MTTPTDTKELLAKINADAVKTPKVPGVTSEEQPAAGKVGEIKFQHYESAKHSVNLITEKGVKFCFIGHKFITSDEHVIAYLDGQILMGRKGYTKGALMTSEEANPMAVYRNKVKAEYEVELREKILSEMKGEYKDMGTTKVPGSSGINPSSTRSMKTGDASSSIES
jgi:hypothetical protein